MISPRYITEVVVIPDPALVPSRYITEVGVIPLYIVDFLLILYVLFNRDVQYAARTGAVVWVSYSWLMAGKVIVLYLKVMPNIHLSGQSEQEENAFPYVMITPTVIRTTLFGNALVYSFLMFRASKAVFGSLSKVSRSE